MVSLDPRRVSLGSVVVFCFAGVSFAGCDGPLLPRTGRQTPSAATPSAPSASRVAQGVRAAPSVAVQGGLPKAAVSLDKSAPLPRASASAQPGEGGSRLANAQQPPLRKSVERQRGRAATGSQREAEASARKLNVVKELFQTSQVPFPPRQLLLRVFKEENRLEVWAAGTKRGPLRHVTSYEVCYASGQLGPKRREGDMQVPEGFYRISWFKARSDYHMAMQVSYPNAADRAVGHPTEPGGQIMIHGDCVSVGCIAMTDDRIEELWVIARAAPRPIAVHIFPTRDWESLLARDDLAQHRPFWRNLREGYQRFESNHQLFKVAPQRDGSYRYR